MMSIVYYHKGYTNIPGKLPVVPAGYIGRRSYTGQKEYSSRGDRPPRPLSLTYLFMIGFSNREINVFGLSKLKINPKRR